MNVLKALASIFSMCNLDVILLPKITTKYFTLFTNVIFSEHHQSSCLLLREKEEKVWRGVIETEFGSLKLPRQCPLVLLVEARLVYGICSILIFKDVGAAVVERN
jgi:hypothetical protein